MNHQPERRRARPATLLAALLVAVLGVFVAEGRGDVLMLASGGRLEGEWLNRDEQPPTSYQLRTSGGLVITLALDQVREAVRQPAAASEYARRAPLAADTAAAQWDLAEWCRKNALSREREAHLRRIVELDPNHQEARRALGFQYLNGRWITRADFRREEGWEFYRGKWRTPQEIEILESRSRTEIAEKDWLLKIRRWRRDLDAPAKARTATAQLAAIRDPAAVRPLAECVAREGARPAKALFLEILARIDTAEAWGVLVDRALNDADEEVFHFCVDRLRQRRGPPLAEPFIAALGDANNFRVNRAALALGRLQDRAAVAPLIEALVTTHTRVLPGRPGVTPGSTTTTFGRDGSYARQEEGPQVQIVRVQNQAALDALHQLTGASFGFDQKAWRYWHAQEKIAQETAAPAPSVRRE